MTPINLGDRIFVRHAKRGLLSGKVLSTTPISLRVLAHGEVFELPREAYVFHQDDIRTHRADPTRRSDQQPMRESSPPPWDDPLLNGTEAGPPVIEGDSGLPKPPKPIIFLRKVRP